MIRYTTTRPEIYAEQAKTTRLRLYRMPDGFHCRLASNFFHHLGATIIIAANRVALPPTSPNRPTLAIQEPLPMAPQ